MCSDIVLSNKRNPRQQTSQASGVSEWMEEDQECQVNNMGPALHQSAARIHKPSF